MLSKTEMIARACKGKNILDIGGSGYGEDNAYERALRKAWSCCRRTVMDAPGTTADIHVDLNGVLPAVNWQSYELVTVFGVLEHLDNPVGVLKWIDSDRLMISLPNSLCVYTRIMEKRWGLNHLYSFTPYTADQFVRAAGRWTVKEMGFLCGKWSVAAKLYNAIGSLWPSRLGTEIFMELERRHACGS